MGVLVVLFLFVSWILWAAAGYKAGDARNAPVSGFILGLLFGPVGVVVALLDDHRPRCAACRERIQRQASLCPHCGCRLSWSPKGALVDAQERSMFIASGAPTADGAPAPRPVMAPAARGLEVESAPVFEPEHPVRKPVPLSSQVRVWTHVSGRKLEGRFVDAGAGRVRLARGDGQIFELPLEKLCNEDRALVERELAQG